MIPAIDILEDVALAPRTTLELGGPARFYVIARDEATLVQALRWARMRGLPVGILGGGSNLVVSDAGFAGLVIELALEGVEESLEGDRAIVTAAAGEDWDGLVGRTVSAGYAGLECLSGIPGRVGATPIQNVGAYGSEVGETLREVRVVDRRTLATRTLGVAECELGYRDSMFKREPDRYVVLSATFELVPDGAPAIRYAELERTLGGDRSLAIVRDTVIALRRGKSMVLDPDDPNRRSAGSFFTNPVLDRDTADSVVARAVAEGLATSLDDVPRWPLEGGARIKLAAGWLIERAGITKGLRRGQVGISTRHALALVHHGGGSARALLELASEVRAAVRARFGVELTPEPTLWGFDGDPDQG